MIARFVLICVFALAAGCETLEASGGCYRGACDDLPQGAPAIVDLGVRGGGGGARVRIISTHPLDPYVFSLATGGDRIVLDFPRVEWRVAGRVNDANQRTRRGSGVVERYRFADHSSTVSRLVLDLREPALVTNRYGNRLINGRYEYVLHLRLADREAFVAAAGYDGSGSGGGVSGASTGGSAGASIGGAASGGGGFFSNLFSGGGRSGGRSGGDAAGNASGNASGGVSGFRPPARATDLVSGNGNFVVVIDPGHGGGDQGAASASGLKEKDVNLAVGLALRDILLNNSRYTVVMTRVDDRSTPLEGRLAWARQSGADLFISLHADSLRSGGVVSGASVYTLSEGGERRARSEVLGEENWLIGVDLSQHDAGVRDILVDLSQERTHTESDHLAKAVIDELGRVGPLVRNTHRQAQYYVLLAPDVPAVLVEMGFLSSTRDAERLARPEHQRRVARALAQAVNSYYNERVRR